MSDDLEDDPIMDIARGRTTLASTNITTTKSPISSLIVDAPLIDVKSNTIESLTSQVSSLSTSPSNLLGNTIDTSSISGITNNLPTTATDLTSSLTGSLSGNISGITNNLTSGLTSGITSGLSSITGNLNGITSGISSITGNISGVTNMISSASTALSSLLNGVTSRLFPALPAYTGKLAYNTTDPYFTDPNKTTNTITGNFTTDVQDKLKDFNTSAAATASSLLSGAGSTANSPVSFVSSMTKKLIEGIDLPGSSEDLSQFANMGIGQLGKLGGLLGEGGSLTDGISSVLSSISDGISAGTQAATGFIKDVYSGISEIASPIVDIVETVHTFTDPRLAGGLVNEMLDFLPDEIQYKLASEATNAMGNITGDIYNVTNNILGVVDNIDSIFDGDLEHILTNMYNVFGPSSNYTISGENGEWIDGQSSWSGTVIQYDALSSIMPTFCGNDYTAAIWNNNTGLKDAFDLALYQGITKGAGKIVEDLVTCSLASTNLTTRSIDIAKSNMSTVAVNGDVYTYQALLDVMGPGIVTTPENDLLNMIAIAPYTDANYDGIRTIMDTLNVTHDDLLTKVTIGDMDIIDGKTALLVQVADPEYKKDFTIAEDFAAINAAMKMYA